MKKKLRGLFRIIFGRTAFVMAGLGLQLWVFIAAFKFLNGYLHYFYILCVLLSALAVIAILNEPIDSSFKMAWIIPVLVVLLLLICISPTAMPLSSLHIRTM